MKLAIIALQESVFVTQRLQKEAENRGHSVTNFYYEDMEVTLGEEVKVSFGNKLLEDYDAIIMRMAQGGGMVYYKDILIREYEDRTFILNGETFKIWPTFGKIAQNYLLSQNGLPVVPTRLFATDQLLDQAVLEYPLIAKKSFGRLGMSVYKADTKVELKTITESSVSDMMIQKFLTTGTDYRIIVLGKKAMPWVMRKTAQKGEWITNYSRGGSIERAKLTKELKTLAEKAARVFKTDYCGVDIMYDADGKPYILEVNRSANFKGFEEVTKINVAEKTIEYIEKKLTK